MEIRNCKCGGVLVLKANHSQLNYTIAKEIICSNADCKHYSNKRKIQFNKNVKYFRKMISWPFAKYIKEIEMNENKMEEIEAQHILMNEMEGYEIILLDIGVIDKQCDLIARKADQTVAIEVTQATKGNVIGTLEYLQNNRSIKDGNLKYDWKVSAKTTIDLSKLGRKRLAEILRSIESQNNNDEIEYRTGQCVNSCEEKSLMEKLKKIGIVYLKAQRSACSRGTFEIIALLESSSPSVYELFRIAHEESNKNDNVKKLESMLTKGKHLFILITGYHNSAASYLFVMPQNRQEFSADDLAKNLELKEFNIPKLIDVVWIGVPRAFHKTGKMGYRLVKIINDHVNSRYILEPVTKDVVRYKRIGKLELIWLYWLHLKNSLLSKMNHAGTFKINPKKRMR